MAANSRARSRTIIALCGKLCLSTVLCSGLAVPVYAQQTAATPDPYINVDEHGVDLVTGKYHLPIVEGSIGAGDGGIALARDYGSNGLQDDWTGSVRIGNLGASAYVVFADHAEKFNLQSGVWVSTKANGGTLVNSAEGWTYTANDGTRVTYKTLESLVQGITDPSTQYGGPGCVDGISANCGLPTQLTKPNGVIYTMQWEVLTACWQNGSQIIPGGGGFDSGGFGEGSSYECFGPFRMTGVESNSSYAMIFDFVSNNGTSGPSLPSPDWYERKSATFVDRSQQGCTASNCSTVTYVRPASNVLEINNSQTGSWRITRNGNNLSIRKPGRTTDTLIVNRDTSLRVTSITDDGVTKSYTWGSSGGNTVVSMVDASGSDGQVVSNPSVGRPSSITDAVNNSVVNTYDANNRLTRTTYPEGNYIQYTRDARGNVTATTAVGKPGSGVSNITSSANYSTTCTNPLTCNQPNFVIDARGNRTDYTYSSVHGGVTRVQAPSAVAGQARPTTDYGYSQLYAKVMNASGALVNQATPQWRLTSITTCSTAATCAGTANETRATIAYNTPNLLPSSVTVAAGNGSLSATTSFAYDGRDNLIAQDGPLSGSDDTVYHFYDPRDRRRGSIGPDPDGAGSQLRAAVRYTFDEESRVLTTEVGTATGTDEAALNAMTVLQRIENVYDTNGNRMVQRLVAGGAVHQLTQFSYDTQNRLQCSAVRMNPAVFGSLPSSACTLSTEGTAGPDRITRATYDALDRVTVVESGVGTAAAGVEWASTFTPNGQAATLTDGESNRTGYAYDGHDRLIRTNYPHPTIKNTTTSFDHAPKRSTSY